jgi:anti-anti-sigma regulatory factor
MTPTPTTQTLNQIRDIVTPELVTETVLDDASRIEIRFVGNADGLTESDFTTYLDDLHRVALESKVKEIVFDVRALEFMSASCLRSLLGWLGRLERTTPRYVVRFISDTRKHWQRRSLELVLASYKVEDVVRVEAI